MPIVQATFWTIIGGYLFLPAKVAIDFPFIPPLDKESIPVVAALVGCRYIKNVKIKLLPKEGVERLLILVLLIIPFITMLNNQDAVNYNPGLTLHDTISSVISLYLKILPFIIGLQLIKTHEDQLNLFRLIVVACLIYSVPIMFEVRMSPQLHTWVYGFFPRSFLQQYRFGGYRATVFLGHGLLVAMFVAVSLGAAAILLKQKIKVFSIHPAVTVVYFLILLFFSKTVGAFVLGVVLFICIIWLPTHMLKWTVLALINVVILYPLLSMAGFFPHQELVQLAMDFDPQRGQSLASRFYNEHQLLEHVQKKIFFGWGGWGRSRLEGSITDGYWIITLGQYGLLGFLATFGLSYWATIRALKVSSLFLDRNKKILLLSHALIVTIIMVDQLPNASMGAWAMLLIGALLGRVRGVNLEVAKKNRV